MFENLINLFTKKKDQPYKFPGISTNYEKNNFIQSEYNRAVDYYREDLNRQDESWKLYSGLDDGQYPKEVVAQMKREGRSPFTGNVIRSKIDGLAGSIIKNFFDISFEPINGELTPLTRYLKELMFIDKELMDWNASYRQLVMDGLIHQGVEELYIDFRYNPLGNIGFRSILPGHILLDPDWISNNAWDLKRAWKTAYLTANQIKEIYGTKSEEIDIYIKMKEGEPSDFENGNLEDGVRRKDLDTKYGDKYRVIEYHHIEKEKKKVEIDIESGLVIPEGNEEFKQEWAIVNGVNLDGPKITREESFDVYYVTSICPDISINLVLEDKKSPMQIGRLPFFPWSSARINGRNSGIPDLLKSIQQTYNFRESMIDYMIKSSAAGGKLIDPSVVDNDMNKLDNLVSGFNKPTFIGITSPGALASGRQYIQELPRSTVDYGIVNELTRMLDMFDVISKQSATLDGQSSGSEDSGIFFARRQLQSEIAQTLLFKSLEQIWNEKGEAYLLVAKQLYSGVYREFYIFGSGEKIELNKPIITPSGEIIENDISELPRMKVIISQSPEGVTTRQVDRAVNTELLRVIPPENPINRALAVKNVMKTLDNAMVEKQEYEEAANLEAEVAKERVITEIFQLKAAQMQLQQQLMMAQQPQIPGLPDAQGGGQEQGEQPQPEGNPNATMTGNDVNAATPQV